MAKQIENKKTNPRVIVKIVLLISILSLIVLLPIIYSGVTYIKAWSNNKKVPFAPTVTVSETTDSSTTTSTTTETPKISGLKLDDAKRIDNKDFNLFDITFYATEYNDRENEKQQVVFSMSLKRNENTPTTLVESASGQTSLVQTGICLVANWIEFESYQSSLSSFTNSYLENNTSRTVTINCKTQFPAKAETWPIKVTVDSPDCYVYVYFRTQESGKYIDNSYILKYSYEEYVTKQTQGGIVR